jgi:hypothetical protein
MKTQIVALSLCTDATQQQFADRAELVATDYNLAVLAAAPPSRVEE